MGERHELFVLALSLVCFAGATPDYDNRRRKLLLTLFDDFFALRVCPPRLRGNTPWVAPACAHCPGFLVLGSAPSPTATLVSEPRIVPLASILLHGPSEIVWICCPQLPHHRAKTGRTAHGFTAQGGIRRKTSAGPGDKKETKHQSEVFETEVVSWPRGLSVPHSRNAQMSIKSFCPQNCVPPPPF